VRTRIVRIGNSKGIRLPKAVIEQVGLVEEVEMQVREGELVISPAEKSRRGWAEAAQALASCNEDHVLDPFVPTAFDEQEWEW